MILSLVTLILHPLTMIVPVLLAVAFLTLLERKTISYMQLRKGPNIVGPYGLLQPIADGIKLFIKEPIRPSTASPLMFILAPVLALTLALALWLPMPLPYPIIDLNLGILFVLALSSLAVYSILGAGWASNSKYALIGALRAVAQTISYEVNLGLILISVTIIVGEFTLQTFATSQESTWMILPLWPLAAMWFISTLAETNRAPFDLTEGESELVSGFNVEYAGGPFALFFLAEYSNILLMNTLSVILFLGASHNPALPELTTINIMVKAAFLSVVFLWVRASFPRFRYDQLMHLTWKNFLPLTLAMVIWNLAIPTAFAGLPPQL
uniref:NADH-ubiquinone oxidoreductase chain 1 n=1 Tax=Solea senegalensis TaxID=28829 RepID=Q0KJ16_SOLSE|nr:NADH dehydrogenase subunit 1 [Solea senegalensis]BAF03540.1 NADH dehydrogenase subunit 1 [Solea senegalensis]